MIPTFDLPDNFNSLTRTKRYAVYPTGTAIGLLVAIVLPVEVPDDNLYFSLNFEANYNLPDNVTQYFNADLSYLLRSITRQTTYDLIESQIQGRGFRGKDCLLRVICEVAYHPIQDTGLFSTLLDIILRPSSSADKNMDISYLRAENHGYESTNCSKYHKKCSDNILDQFSNLI